jgi:hypothetical protein
MTHASIVSPESVCIALTLVALKDLDVKMVDIENTNMMATITEKVWTVLGPEFGVYAGKKTLVVRAHYGLKYSGVYYTVYLMRI